MYRVVLSRRAEKALRALSPSYAQRVREALESFRDNPRIQGTVKLENTPVAQYRRRVGDYRILFDIDEKNRVVQVLDIRRRGRVMGDSV